MNNSKIILGGNLFGYSCDKYETIKIIERSLDFGINSIDTADVYGNGTSEILIGESIKSNRSKYFIASKIGAKSGEKFDKKGTFKYINKAIDNSLKRLNTNYIDLYQLHHYDKCTPLDETISTLETLKKEGKILNYGFSNLTIEQYNSIILFKRNFNYFDKFSLQMPYNIFKRDLEGFFKYNSNDFNIIVYSVLARGILSDKYFQFNHLNENNRANLSKSVNSDITQEIIETVKKIDNFAKNKNATISQIAIAWVLNNKFVNSSIIGIRNVDQLLDNYRAIEINFTKEELLELDIIVGALEKYNNYHLGFINPESL